MFTACCAVPKVAQGVSLQIVFENRHRKSGEISDLLTWVACSYEKCVHVFIQDEFLHYFARTYKLKQKAGVKDCFSFDVGDYDNIFICNHDLQTKQQF